MKFELPLQKIKHSLALVERVSGKHATLPVLSCILVEVSKGSVVLRATNLDIGIEVSCVGKTEGEGSVAVPSHILSSFISQLPDQGTVICEVVAGNLLVSSTRSKVTIKTVPADDFPAIPRVAQATESKVSADIFIKGLKSVWYSASVSSVKPELSSVYVYRDNEFLVFVATDSFRLAEKKVQTPSSVTISDLLIPFKNISDIIRILESVNGSVSMKSNKNLISFENEDIYIVSRVVDGVFPDYRQIIPKGYVTEAVALKQDVLNGLKISNIFSDKFNQVRMVIDPKKKIFEIHTKNSDVGENTTTVDAALSGDSMEINFNYRYVADCFQSIDADSVSFQLSGLNRPMVIRPVSGDQTFMYLAMPMTR